MQQQDTDDETDRAVIELDPDDMGATTVQDNGMLYVGREYGGEKVRWVIERTDE